MEKKKQAGWHIPTSGHRAGKKSRCANIYNCGLKGGSEAEHFLNEGDAIVAAERFEKERAESKGVDGLSGLKKFKRPKGAASVTPLVTTKPDFADRIASLKSEQTKKTVQLNVLRKKIDETEFSGTVKELRQQQAALKEWEKEARDLTSRIALYDRNIKSVLQEKELYDEHFPESIVGDREAIHNAIMDRVRDGDDYAYDYPEYTEIALEVHSPTSSKAVDFNESSNDLKATISELTFKYESLKHELENEVVTVKAKDLDKHLNSVREREDELRKYKNQLSGTRASLEGLNHQKEAYESSSFYDMPASVHSALWNKAWSDGHAYGYQEVKEHYRTLCDFAYKVHKTKQD